MRAGRGGRGGGGDALRNSGQAGVEVLTSRENRWLKEFRVALRGGVPTASGGVGVEGVRLVEEALGSGCRVEAVLFSESGEKHRERLAPLVGKEEMGFQVLRTTDRLFEGIADTEHPQGVAALVVPRVFELEELFKWRGGDNRSAEGAKESDSSGAKAHSSASSKSELKLRPPKEKTQDPLSEYEDGATTKNEGVCAPLLVVLAGVQDPGNVGTIVRTAAAFGATGVVTAATGQSGTASPYAPKAMRASAGAALHLPIVGGMGLGILLTQLRVRGIRSLASCVAESASGTVAPWEVDWREPVALLVGNDGAGLPDDVVSAADARVHVPMATRVESLNAAAAAAVVLYEAFRQRRNGGEKKA